MTGTFTDWFFNTEVTTHSLIRGTLVQTCPSIHAPFSHFYGPLKIMSVLQGCQIIYIYIKKRKESQRVRSSLPFFFLFFFLVGTQFKVLWSLHIEKWILKRNYKRFKFTQHILASAFFSPWASNQYHYPPWGHILFVKWCSSLSSKTFMKWRQGHGVGMFVKAKNSGSHHKPP